MPRRRWCRSGSAGSVGLCIHLRCDVCPRSTTRSAATVVLVESKRDMRFVKGRHLRDPAAQDRRCEPGTGGIASCARTARRSRRRGGSVSHHDGRARFRPRGRPLGGNGRADDEVPCDSGGRPADARGPRRPRQGVELLDLEQAPPHLRPQLRLGHVLQHEFGLQRPAELAVRRYSGSRISWTGARQGRARQLATRPKPCEGSFVALRPSSAR